ncbi:MAG: polymerase subunit gamma and tau, partial [Actinotalea sp.]|nr:polymerase subunit gamma and tau [Actinotalea sp.]
PRAPAAPASRGSASTTPSAPAAAAPAGLDAEVVRRRWPEVLQTLRGLRMATWVLVSQNAQVSEVTAVTVTLAFTTPQLATTFRTGPHAENVQRALHETLGIDVRIETALAESATASAVPAPSPVPGTTGVDEIGRVSASDAEASWTTPVAAATAEAPASDSDAVDLQPGGSGRPVAGAPDADPYADVPDGPEPDPEPDPGGPLRSAAPAGRATAGSSGGSPSMPRRPWTARAATPSPASPTVIEDGDDADPDDPELASSGLVGAPLVAQMLGGTVIDEIPDDPR